MVQHFWERIDAGGRDIDDMGQWCVGDELMPTGPPRAYTILVVFSSMLMIRRQTQATTY